MFPRDPCFRVQGLSRGSHTQLRFHIVDFVLSLALLRIVGAKFETISLSYLCPFLLSGTLDHEKRFLLLLLLFFL